MRQQVGVEREVRSGSTFSSPRRLLNRKTLEDLHKAKLIRKAQTLRLPATRGDLQQVCLG